MKRQLLQVAADGWCTLDAWVIMPDPVHVPGTPQVPLSTLIRKVKGPTARRANPLSGADGPFWQDEYFDRIVRNEQEYRGIRRYIEWNLVRATLAASPEDFIWSSAHGQAALAEAPPPAEARPPSPAPIRWENVQTPAAGLKVPRKLKLALQVGRRPP